MSASMVLRDSLDQLDHLAFLEYLATVVPKGLLVHRDHRETPEVRAIAAVMVNVVLMGLPAILEVLDLPVQLVLPGLLETLVYRELRVVPDSLEIQETKDQ